MKYAKLLKTTISANYLWKGDRVYITTKWQACDCADFVGKVQIDFEFGSQRQLECDYNNLSFSWDIYPHMYLWETGSIYETAGAYNVPPVWGGTRHVYVSLLDDNDIPVPFLNARNEVVLREHVASVEFAFSTPGTYLKSLVTPIETVDSPANSVISHAITSVPKIILNDLIFHIVVKIRDIKENTIITNINNDLFEYKKTGNGLKISSDLASCSIIYQEEKLILTDVTEKNGYELLHVYIPDLSVMENADIVNFSLGGRRASSQNNPPLGFCFMFDVINAMGIYDDKYGILLNSDRLDFVFHQSIQRINKKSFGVVGVELTNRVTAKICDLKSPCVKGEKSVSIKKLPRADWKTFAYELQKALNPKKVACYDRCIFYKFMLDHGNDEPKASLDDLRKLYREIANICDNQRQVAYIVGWQKDGHDHGYPEPFQLNEAISSANELKNCIEEARNYNTYLSLHDNFEDAYLNCISDKSLIAADAYGEKYKGWIWDGGLSYILSLKRYAETGIMQKRVKWIIDNLGIKDTYHIDVTTSEMRRYDFSPDISCAADESLQYKYKIFEEFNKYGIDVTSETVAYPFIGKTGHGWSSRYNSTASLYLEEEKIPLTYMLYHGIISCGCFGFDKQRLLHGFVIGAKSCWGDVVTLDQERIKSHYILSIPMLLFEDLKMTDYKTSGDWTTTTYENNSRIMVNKKDEEYEVIYKGKTIAKNWMTFSPGATDDILYLYSLNDAEYNTDEEYCFYELTKDGSRKIGKQKKLHLKAGVPIKGVRL